MTTLYFTTAILCGVAKYITDTINFRYSTSIFARLNPLFWNPAISWRNKWKDGSTTKERFFLSSTLLVFTTDAWHLFTLVQYLLIFVSSMLCIICNFNVLLLFAWWVFYLGVFEVMFRWVK